VNLIGYVDLSS